MTIRELLINNLWALYLGASIAKFGGITIFDWNFYVIILPTVIFVALKDL